ncbi:MAG: chitin disaccharide deacetylase [Thermincolia bacterium]
MKRLIVNADDFGLSHGVNQGIIKAHGDGIVTSTTVMVNLPAAREIVEAAKFNPELGIGIHLNITFGRPLFMVDRITSLVDEQGNLMRPEVIWERVEPKEVAMEWEAQVGEFLSWGLKPSHLDSHHHVHTWPQLRSVAAALAKELGIPVRFRDKETKDILHEASVRYCEHFVEGFFGEATTEGDLNRILTGLLPGTTEIMCHPALPDRELTDNSSYGDIRGQELATLTQFSLKDTFKELGIHLINFRQL